MKNKNVLLQFGWKLLMPEPQNNSSKYLENIRLDQEAVHISTSPLREDEIENDCKDEYWKCEEIRISPCIQSLLESDYPWITKFDLYSMLLRVRSALFQDNSLAFDGIAEFSITNCPYSLYFEASSGVIAISMEFEFIMSKRMSKEGHFITLNF